MTLARQAAGHIFSLPQCVLQATYPKTKSCLLLCYHNFCLDVKASGKIYSPQRHSGINVTNKPRLRLIRAGVYS